MRNEEAITELSVLWERMKRAKESGVKTIMYYDGQYVEALDLAIKALEQQPCEDCISRDDAIELIAGVDKTDGNEPVFSGKQIIKMLKSLPSVTPKARWIPVSERLPEIEEKDCHGNITFSKTVLTSQKYGDGFIYIGNDKYTTNNGGGWLSEVPFDDPDECCEVIAWMPLPQPYGESEDKE